MSNRFNGNYVSVKSFLFANKEELIQKATKAEQQFRTILNKTSFSYQFQRVFIKAAAIVDFYIPKGQLAIEIDGASHLNRKKLDKNKEALLKELYGIKTIRFHNNMVKNIKPETLQKIIYVNGHWRKRRKKKLKSL